MRVPALALAVRLCGLVHAHGTGALHLWHHSMQTRVRKRLADQGAILLEFAISFPFVLVLFISAYQIIQVYNFDILGVYAAYAAARSYAVFRNHEGWSDRNAAVLARDVAASVMAPYSAPQREAEHKWQGAMCQGVRNYWQGPVAATEFLGSTVAYRTAVSRMSDDSGGGAGLFTVTEYGDEGKSVLRVPRDAAPDGTGVHSEDVGSASELRLLFREGYGYRKQDEEGGGQSGNWFWEQVLEYIQDAWDSFWGNKENRCPMKVARVSFSYRYPLWIGFLQRGPLQSRSGAGVAEHLTVPIYQACASPVEPLVIVGDQAQPNGYEDVDLSNDEDQRQLRALNHAIIKRLLAFNRYLYEDASEPECDGLWDGETAGGVAAILADRTERFDRHAESVAWRDLDVPATWDAAVTAAREHVPVLTAPERKEDTVAGRKTTFQVHDFRDLLRQEIEYRTTVCNPEEFTRLAEVQLDSLGGGRNAPAGISRGVSSWIPIELRHCLNETHTLANDLHWLGQIDGEYAAPTVAVTARESRKIWQYDAEGRRVGSRWSAPSVYDRRHDVDTDRLSAWARKLSGYCQGFGSTFAPNKRYSLDSTYREQGDTKRQSILENGNYRDFAVERSSLRTELLDEKAGFEAMLQVWKRRGAAELRLLSHDGGLLDALDRHVSRIRESLEDYYSKQVDIRAAKSRKIAASRAQMAGVL